MKELAVEIYRACLGRHPTKNDAPRFQQRTNADNNSINDQYFDGRKIGSFMTNYILDIRGIFQSGSTRRGDHYTLSKQAISTE